MYLETTTGEMVLATKNELLASVASVISEVRMWCESQVELWQQIPNLALEADGRNGYSANRSYCYNYGFWRIWENSPRGGYLLCSVDCETGKLAYDIDSYKQGSLIIADDKSVVPLLTRLDEIDAAKIIATLEATINTPILGSVASVNPNWPKKQKQIRAATGLGFGVPYARRSWQSQ